MTNESQPSNLLLQRRVLSDGTECPLPIRYFDSQNLIATFLTGMDRAVEMLKGTGLQAVPQEDGKAIVVLACWEHRDTDLGPYNEVGLAILAVAPGDLVPALYVVNLPVATTAAYRAGREIWGFNKFVTAIDITRDDKKFSTSVRDPDNALIVTLEGTRGASTPMAPADIFTFTLLAGKVIKTLVQVPTPSHASTGDSFLLKVGNSEHPMANNLRALALDGARPVLVQFADPFQAILHSGRTL
ncbi:MAG TPA: acetoacetate decarboxylase family protein [Acetobacteraceae bacterium]|nr:acetoacetate decarboxylase family protein [Acetobacteraceae bacterium]